MKSSGTTEFWRAYRDLPVSVREVARKNYRLWQQNSRHPSLHFKKTGKLWSIRVGIGHRALAIETSDGYCWVFQLTFLHRPAEAEKLQVVAALERLLGLFRQMLRQRGGKIVRLARLEGALIGTGLDLVEQDIAAPAEARRGAEGVKPGRGSGSLIENQEILSPRDFCDKLPQKSGWLLIG